MLVGTTVGAGMFGIPYVFSRFGFFPSLVYLLVLAGVMLFLNLLYGEVILRTPGDHQIFGYVRFYLEEKTKVLSFINIFSFFISIYGALLAYGIKIGEFLQMILGFGSPVLFSLLFFFFALVALYFGLHSLSFLEFLIVVLVVLSVLTFFLLSVGKLDVSNLTGFRPLYLLLPYGVILFALNGTSVIPEMEEVLRKNPEKLGKSILVGILIPLVLYILFALVVVGNCGAYTSEDGISCLFPFLPHWAVKLGAFVGILTMASSFLTLSYVLKESWFRDFKFSETAAFLLAGFPPLILYISGVRSFIRVLDFSGAVSVGLSGILILLMHREAKVKGKREPAYSLKVPRPLLFFLSGLFILGAFSPFLTRIY